MNPNPSAVDAYGRCRIQDQPDCRHSGYHVPPSRPMTVTVTTPTSELLADPASVALIRDLYAHARAVRAEHATYSFGNGRGQAMAPVEHTWTVGHDRVLIHDGWLIYLRRGAPLLKVQIDTARQVGQLLAAIGVLPERFIAGGTR